MTLEETRRSISVKRARTKARTVGQAWSSRAAWREAELRDLDEAMDWLVLERDAKAADRPEPRTIKVRRILVGVDGSDSGDQAAGWAIGLAKLFGARVWAITVLAPKSAYAKYARQPGWKMSGEEMMRGDEENGRRILDATIREMNRARVPAEPILTHGSPEREIARAVDEHGVDLVILGSHGPGGKDRPLLGAVAEGVKNSTKANVLFVRNDYRPGRLLAPIDGSIPSRLAAYFAVGLAKLWKIDATVLHVYEVPWIGSPEWGASEFQDLIRRFDLPTRPKGVRYVLELGKSAPKIVSRAQADGTGLIVMGSRGLGKLRSLVTGSVSNRVSHESRTSVMLVKRTASY